MNFDKCLDGPNYWFWILTEVHFTNLREHFKSIMTQSHYSCCTGQSRSMEGLEPRRSQECSNNQECLVLLYSRVHSLNMPTETSETCSIIYLVNLASMSLLYFQFSLDYFPDFKIQPLQVISNGNTSCLKPFHKLDLTLALQGYSGYGG